MSIFEDDVTLVGVRVLVVDDYKSIANGLCRHLRVLGHDARVAYSGSAALAEASVFEPDVVLLDINLPDMIGYDVARAIKSKAHGHVYIAAISTRIGIPDANIDEHARKPFGLERLAAILQEATKRTTR